MLCRLPEPLIVMVNEEMGVTMMICLDRINGVILISG